MPTTLDVFIDLTGGGDRRPAAAIQAAVDSWRWPERLGFAAGQVRLVVPHGTVTSVPLPSVPGWCIADGASPSVMLNAALQAAGQRGAALLVLTGAVDVGCEAIGALLQRLARDPMFGFAIPRVACTGRCCIARLTRHGTGPTGWIPRKVLSDLPEAEILVETLAPCVLIAPQVAGNFGPLDPGFATVTGALLHYMGTARRCGFRTVLCNRAVVGGDGLVCGSREIVAMPALPAADRERLHRALPESDRGWTEFRGAGWERFEELCTAMSGPRRSLLLDVRNVGAVYNGTTHAVLGLVSALRDGAADWDMALLADPRGAAFHDYQRMFPGWPVYSSPPDRPFTVAFRPSQPWHIRDMADLHHCALINAYLILDTISWDITYWAPPGLEGVWCFLADHADGLLYDSEFTRRRFAERFPSERGAPEAVTHFSLDAAEYRGGRAAPAEAPFVLVVGNHLDHKDVRQTVATLASAFPYQPITSLGPADATSPFVTARQSGSLSEADVQNLYASARFVVYPSFYEGFGFPVVNALAHGRTVLARRSALLDELAQCCDGGGRLIAFDTREELVELLGRLLHGDEVPELTTGAARRNGPARTWRDAAADTHRFLSTLVGDGARAHWIARERALSQLRSFSA